MKYIYLSIYFIFLFVIKSVCSQECSAGGCTNLNLNYPLTIVPATSTWSKVNSTQGAFINGGNYAFYNLTAGYTYYWSTCSSIGGVTGFDAELTLFDCNGTPICFSENSCGIGPYLAYYATSTCTVKVLLSAINNSTTCQNNGPSAPYCTLMWRRSPIICNPVIQGAIQPQNQTVSVGNTATFTASVNGTPPFSYFWYKNGSFIANKLNTSSTTDSYTTPTVSTSNDGDFYYCLTSSCNNMVQVQSNTATLSVNQNCSLPSTPPNPTHNSPVCGSVTITRSGSVPVNEIWYWQGTSCGTSMILGSGPTYIANSSGTYYLRAYKTPGDGCWSNSCSSVSIIVNPGPPVTASSNSPVSAPNNINLFASTIAGASYSWNGPNGFSSVQQNPVITTSNSSMSGEYCVTTTLAGCSSQSCTTVNVNESSIPIINSLIGTNVILDHLGIETTFAFYEDYSPYSNNEPIKICADGSTATFLKINASNTNGLSFRLKDETGTIVLNGSTTSDIEKYGKFGVPYPINSNQLEVAYTHPNYMDYGNINRPCTLEIIYNGNTQISIPFKIYRAPVLFVHGWLGDSGTFSTMENNFKNTNVYPWPLLHRHDYSYSNYQGFSYNLNVVSEGINDLFTKARNEHFSFSKTNVVAHSMGGILSRLYLQSSNYRNDIYKLVTLNTPHSGTQGANFLYDFFCGGVSIYNFIFNDDLSCYSNYLDAIRDMKVNSTATRELLNGNRLNKHIVPSFSISTEDDFATDDDCKSFGTLFFSNFYKVVTYAFIHSIFNLEQNDLVVPISSQRGGLNKYAHFYGQCHLKSSRDFGIISSVRQLMNEKPDAANFDINGFNPPVLTSIYPRSTVQSQQLSGSIDIVSPTNNNTFLPGQQISIETLGSSNVQKTVMVIGNNLIPCLAKDTLSPITTTNYTIPMEAFGEIRIIAVGYDTLSGMIAFDTLRINVQINSVLDSLKSNKNILRIPLTSTASLPIDGFFSDGIIRNLSSNDSLEYLIADTLISKRINRNIFSGVALGQTNVNISFRNISIQIPIEVYQSEEIISANFSSDKKLVCLGETINFSDVSFGNVISRTWQFPGGIPSTSSSENPIIMYNISGTYDVMIISEYTGGFDTLTMQNYITVGEKNKTVNSGHWKDPSIWSCGYIPSYSDTVTISSGNVVTIDSGITIKRLHIESNAAINLEDSTALLVIGSDTDKTNQLESDGVINISNGTLKIYGNLFVSNTGEFNMTGGKLIIDGNTGDPLTSIPDGQHLFNILTVRNNFHFIGGTLQIINPPLGGNSQAINCNHNFSPSSTLMFGDGISTIASNNPNGFGGDLLPPIIGKLILNAVTDQNNRIFTNTDSLIITDTCKVLSGMLKETAALQILKRDFLPNSINLLTGLVAWYPFSGNAIDSSGNGNHGIVNGSTLSEDRFGRADHAYYFNGNTDYIEIAHSSSLNFGATNTFSFWIKASPTLASGKENYFFAKHNPNDDVTPLGISGIHGCVSTYSPSQPSTFFRYDRSTWGQPWGGVTILNTPAYDVWTNVVFVVGETADSIYINGIMTQTEPKAPSTIIGLNNYPMYFGMDVIGWSGIDAAFKGQIDDIRIYNRVLTSAEVNALYHEGGY